MQVVACANVLDQYVGNVWGKFVCWWRMRLLIVSMGVQVFVLLRARCLCIKGTNPDLTLHRDAEEDDKINNKNGPKDLAG